MRKQILIVDDEKNERLFIQNELKSYEHLFFLLMAQDGLEAIEVVKRIPISLVISDIHMPRMDGIRLLVYMTEHYPDIPVLINIGYSGQEVGRQVQANGAEGFIEKPIHTPTLINQIQSVLNRQSNGGTLRDVSTGTFLQMLEMENRSCTVRVMENHSETLGALFVRNGRLVDARSNGSRGQAAAFKILAWDDVTLFIQNNCPDTKESIRGNLQALLLESMRVKDEQEMQKPQPAQKEARIVTPEHRQEASPPPRQEPPPPAPSPAEDSSLDDLLDEFLSVEEGAAPASQEPELLLQEDAPPEVDSSLDALLDEFEPFDEAPVRASSQPAQPAQPEEASLDALLDDFQPFDNTPTQPLDLKPQEKALVPKTEPEADVLTLIKRKLELKAGKRCGLNDIYHDPTWTPFINGVTSIAPLLDAGAFHVGFVSRGKADNYFLLAGKVPTVVAVEPQCMRNKIMRTLCEEFSVK